jgi:hypothetical protein
MTTKSFGRVFLVLAAFGLLPLAAFADEIVHFTNGAEMTVRTHTVEQDKHTVRLDLGGNSFIAFPMSMVDKIVSAGQDVYLNPVFHPSNQAIGGAAGGAVTENAYRGTAPGNTSGGRPVPNARQGAMLGEAADPVPAAAIGGSQVDHTVANSRRVFNPAFPAPQGGQPQVIMPPGMAKAPAVVSMAAVPFRPAEPPTPPPPTATPEDPPPSDPPPEDPPDSP